MCICCTSNELSKLYFLEGTWKVEGKEKFEVWERVGSSELTGFAYKLVDGQKNITETLRIKIEGGSIVYQATVPDQNEGVSVSFVLNESDNSCFSFENKKHDFPKKNQYKKVTKTKLEIQVLGDQDKGFSFVQKKE
ncbi:DUF6265 family protein [Labilibaculum antarcticum]|uniref:DUF6265 family protein n=1 Tax=Labilibaculum antarcticum TaxID=1717717 RepID=UPI0029374812|nr:DUF6265 family protein [Labilibaculum antarcticum]